MDTVVLASRFLLAIVFVIAAVTKALDMKGTRQAVTEFGVPRRFVRSASALLPVAEVAAAVTLVPGGTAAVVGATLSFVLLVAFSVGIVDNLRRGRRPDCHCFGQLHSTPVGWTTLARNGFLAALGLLVVIANGGPNPR